VRLDELRNVLQSDETVMRLVFRDHHTDSPYSISGVPYIRGSVLSDYYVAEGGHSGWKQRSSWVAQSPEELQDEISALMPGEAIPLEIAKRTRLLQAPRHDFLVRQEAILEPLDEAVLFAVHPVFAFDGTSDDVAMDLQSERLYSQRQRDGSMRHEYRYVLLTTALRGGLQLEVTPHAIRRRMMWNDFYVDQEKRRLLEFDAQRFPQLKAIADEIAQRPRTAGSPTATLARALRDHFLVPGRYVYSLDFSTIPRDRRLDPIEDFVANHRTGHCEYYASALAMMLRSQGIPARLVIGFHCDEYNAVGGYYQVRQRHAHAWVEAFLEPEEVTEELPSGSDTSPYGGWLRLDATPGFDVDRAVQVRQGIIERIDDVLDYAQLLWSDYILGLTATRQRETIYDPVTERADPETWSNWMEDLAERRRDMLRWMQDYLLRPSTLAALTLTALLLSVWWVKAASRRPGLPPVVQRVSRWTARLTGQNPDAAGRAMLAQHIGFYRRFERLLARLGLSRTAGQTQREFATEAAVRLRDISETPDPLDFTTRLVQAFYRVRFGRELLDAAEKETLDNGLTALERHLAEHPNGRPDRERSDV
jgi:protein-glutamine gamma-glutamyltransferase